jgi:hypothetical protein
VASVDEEVRGRGGRDEPQVIELSEGHIVELQELSERTKRAEVFDIEPQDVTAIVTGGEDRENR